MGGDPFCVSYSSIYSHNFAIHEKSLHIYNRNGPVRVDFKQNMLKRYILLQNLVYSDTYYILYVSYCISQALHSEPITLTLSTDGIKFDVNIHNLFNTEPNPL